MVQIPPLTPFGAGATDQPYMVFVDEASTGVEDEVYSCIVSRRTSSDVLTNTMKRIGDYTIYVTIEDLPGNRSAETVVCTDGASTIKKTCETTIKLDREHIQNNVNSYNSRYGAGTATYRESVARTLIHELQHHGLYPRDSHGEVGSSDPAIMNYPIGISTAGIFKELFGYDTAVVRQSKGLIPRPIAGRPACVN